MLGLVVLGCVGLCWAVLGWVVLHCAPLSSRSWASSGGEGPGRAPRDRIPLPCRGPRHRQRDLEGRERPAPRRRCRRRRVSGRVALGSLGQLQRSSEAAERARSLATNQEWSSNVDLPALRVRVGERWEESKPRRRRGWSFTSRQSSACPREGAEDRESHREEGIWEHGREGSHALAAPSPAGRGLWAVALGLSRRPELRLSRFTGRPTSGCSVHLARRSDRRSRAPMFGSARCPGDGLRRVGSMRYDIAASSGPSGVVLQQTHRRGIRLRTKRRYSQGLSRVRNPVDSRPSSGDRWASSPRGGAPP